MNKQQQPTTDNTTDNTQLIQKLRSEYEELHKKSCKLYAFRHSLDVDQKMNFDMEALDLMQRQLELMEAYRHNLYLRIRHLARLSIEIKTEHDPNFDEVDPELKAQALHHCDQDTRRRDEAAAKLCDLLVKCRMVVFAPREKCAKCGGDLFEGLGTAEGEKTLCFNCANQITNDELQQALDEYRAACIHHCGQDTDLDDACCHTAGKQDDCPVGGGSAAVNQENGDSLNDLLGMEVISVGDMPCDACNPDNYAGRPCVKVELFGGTYLCLAPQPNSIIS